MNVMKPCTACGQVVYPLEQLRCLDQVWHKRCFRCQQCGMALNMNSYRGYEKKPYCVAHYPQPKRFTVVPDTPELQRVAQNTKVLSNANYHQRFCQAGGLDAQHRPNLSHQHRSVSATPVLLGSHGNHLMEDNNHNGTDNAHSQEHLIRRQTPSNGHLVSDSGHDHHHHAPQQKQQPTAGTLPSQTNGRNAYGHAIDERSSGPLLEAQSADTQQFRNRSSEVTAPAPLIDPDTKYRAVYEFHAREDDEVSFMEGDIIVNADPVAEGWMYGTVQRTGQFGMLPSNYLEVITN